MQQTAPINFYAEALKRQRRNIPPEVRKAVWQTHMPPGSKEALCPLCDEVLIRSSTKNGFDCAHIVADKFHKGEHTVLYLYPSCGTCNNECEDVCLLDYLWNKGSGENLKRMIRSVYKAFLSMNPYLPIQDRLMWKVLERLYGYERFSAGGGLVNEIPIYMLAQSEHLLMINKQMKEKTEEMEMLATEMQMLSTTRITCKRPVFA